MIRINRVSWPRLRIEVSTEAKQVGNARAAQASQSKLSTRSAYCCATDATAAAASSALPASRRPPLTPVVCILPDVSAGGLHARRSAWPRDCHPAFACMQPPLQSLGLGARGQPLAEAQLHGCALLLLCPARGGVPAAGDGLRRSCPRDLASSSLCSCYTRSQGRAIRQCCAVERSRQGQRPHTLSFPRLELCPKKKCIASAPAADHLRTPGAA